MRKIGIVFLTEFLKVRKSKVFIGTILFFMFMALMMSLMTLLVSHPEIANRSAIASAKISLLGDGDWASFLGMLIQMILTMGVIGFGFVSAWVFGREFSDRTIKDLLALPVSRGTFVAAKMLVILVWCVILSLLFFLMATLFGILFKFHSWSSSMWINTFISYMVAGILNICLVTWVSFFASIGRGFLLPIAFVVLTLIITQMIFVASPAMALYLPWATPALFSGIAGPAAPKLNSLNVIIYTFTVVSGYIGTVLFWKFADHK